MSNRISKWNDHSNKGFSSGNEGLYSGEGSTRYNWFEKRMPSPPAKLLEIGFNSSKALHYFEGKGYECTGVDLPSVVKYHGIFPNIEYRAINMDNSNAIQLVKELPNNYYDIVILGEVIQHIVFDENLLYAVWHYLKPNGHLLLSTENVNLVEHALRYYPTLSLKRTLEILGFKILDESTTGQVNYIWIHAKKIPNEGVAE